MSNQAGRLDRGALEAETLRVCNDFITGAITLEEGKTLTPHAIAVQIEKNRGDGARKASAGAITENLRRWEAVGYATLGTKPTCFLDYTEAGKTEGLSALKAKFSETAKAARAAERGEKSGKKAAKAAPAVTPDEAVTPEAPAEPATAPEQSQTVNDGFYDPLDRGIDGAEFGGAVTQPVDTADDLSNESPFSEPSLSDMAGLATSPDDGSDSPF